MKTYSAKPTDITRAWHLVDASELPLGRLSTQVAQLLTGKMKPIYTHHIDCGDFVVIINAKDLIVTGDKREMKTYYKHSGFPGGLTETSLKDKLAKDPSTVIFKSVRGMLPINKLRDGRLARLKIYNGPEHQHDAQKPKMISIKELQ
jgi:large subunit ribosomal protein L13